MTPVDDRPVRMVCTDDGQHQGHPKTVATLRLTADSVEHVRSTRTTAPFNRDSFDQLRRQHRAEDGRSELPDFDRPCPSRGCTRNIRANAERMRRIVVAALQLDWDSPVVEIDISRRPWANLF
jgi:hypothetical protein